MQFLEYILMCRFSPASSLPHLFWYLLFPITSINARKGWQKCDLMPSCDLDEIRTVELSISEVC